MKGLCELLRREGVDFRTEYRLSAHSSFRIGGPAELAVFPKTREELTLVLHAAAMHDLPLRTVGRASNVVFPDEGLRGVLIVTTACRRIQRFEDRLVADAGVTLYELAIAAEQASLSGAEFAHGIPGTVGGGVWMNAGAYDGCIADLCVESSYFDPRDGSIGTISGAAHRFGYRTSIYKENPDYTILGASFVLHPGERDAIRAKMEDYRERRRKSQPLEYPSAGSVFKRPEGYFAGKLIEDAGWKGRGVGGAQVSEKHAGFIVNRGGATARDVRCLVEEIREDVLKKFGVELECEIGFW